MKKIIFFILLTAASLTAVAQSSGENFLKQAKQSLANNEYVKARYNYLKAYEAFANENKLAEAIPCAVNVAALYHRENFYKEAFETLGAAEYYLNNYETKSGNAAPALHYPIVRERQQMYLKLRNVERANDQLSRMQTLVEQAADSTLMLDMLSVSALQYYAFGQTERGDQALNKLIAVYKANNKDEKVAQTYKGLIDSALKAGNTQLLSRAYNQYIAWSDSVGKVAEEAKIAALEAKNQEAQSVIKERDSSLTAKNAFIVTLCIIAGILAVALVLGVGLYLRNLAQCKKQKEQIYMMQAHNEVKTRFLSHIGDRLYPVLDAMPQNLPGVEALRSFLGHIQQLSALESSLSEIYPTESVDLVKFSKQLTDGLQDKVATDVRIVTDVPKMEAPISPEPLKTVLSHLLANAADHTPAGGKITLEFKKRSPHHIQFIVTDSGPGVPEEERADLFMPFAAGQDITKGDRLGLPICALLTSKMNGMLRLDDTYTKGARFVVELHP